MAPAQAERDDANECRASTPSDGGASSGIKRSCVISGQAIAKSKWYPRERARFAARWKLGAVQVDPTIKLAADVFNVSVPYVVEAIGDLKASTPDGTVDHPTTLLDSIWDDLCGFERDAFVSRHLIEVWDAVERTTV